MITPDKFAEASVYDLLEAAATGRVGLDQRWVRAIVERAESPIPDLVRFGMADHHEDPIPLDEELMLMFRHLRSPEAIPFFVHYLRSAPSDLPENFVDALLPVRQQALDPLVELYDEMSEDDAGEVAFALAAFRIRDDRVLRILLDRLEYDVADGAICLELYGDPAAKPALEKMLAEVEDERLKRVIGDALEQIDRPTQSESDAPFDLYEYFPEKARPEFSVLSDQDLLELLDAPDAEYRAAAASGFINQELEPEIVDRLFEKARTDPDERVRAKCWEALGNEIADDEEIFRAMLARLEDESAPEAERSGALAGLGNRANEEPVRRYAEQFYTNPATRAAALAAMWNSLDNTFASYFPPHISDPDPEIRKQAISGIGYLGIHDSAEKLREYFADDDYRPNALFAYALAVRAEITPGRVRGLLRRIDEAAGGLTEEENELVKMALDERLLLNGHKPVFHSPEEGEDDAPEAPHQVRASEPGQVAKVGRNDPCPCGSGKKFKKCHGG